jgi:hypothetical protein
VLPVRGTDELTGFRFDSDFTPMTGIEHPWICSTGLIGEIDLKIMGIEEKEVPRRVTLHGA